MYCKKLPRFSNESSVLPKARPQRLLDFSTLYVWIFYGYIPVL